MEVKVKSLLSQGEIFLKEKNIETFKTDAFYILKKHIPITRGDILLDKTVDIETNVIDDYFSDIQKRCNYYPLQYILGSWEFMGLEFLALTDVLIPRSETEMLCEYIINNFKGKKLKILDACCGSGCIGLSLKKFCDDFDVTLMDISEKAIFSTTQNAKSLNLYDKVTIIKGDVFLKSESYFKNENFDIIVSNPPYIKTKDLENLQKEVKFEPKKALDGGEDGILFYKCFADDWSKCLKDNGIFVFEAGFDTAKDVAALFKDAKVYKDIHLNDRMVIAGKIVNEKN